MTMMTMLMTVILEVNGNDNASNDDDHNNDSAKIISTKYSR